KRFDGQKRKRSLSTTRVNESARICFRSAGEFSSSSARSWPTLSPSKAKVWISTDCRAICRSALSLGQNSLKSTRSSMLIGVGLLDKQAGNLRTGRLYSISLSNREFFGPRDFQ